MRLFRLLVLATNTVMALHASSCAGRAARAVRDQAHFADVPVQASATGKARGPADGFEESALAPQDLPQKPFFAHAFNAEADLERAGMLAEGAEGSGEIALTFDDGPGAETTTEVLRILAAHKVKGAFFLTGSRLAGSGVVAELQRGVARAIVDEGHVIGNHALDHLPLHDEKGEAWCTAQIEESALRIAEATGVSPHYFRPPYGKLGTIGRRVVIERGDELVMWTIDAQDALPGKDPDPERLARRLIGQIIFAGQGVVLLHDLRPSSVKALAILLDWAEAHGRRVVDLPTYLAHAAARPWPFSTRLELLRARERMHRKTPAPL